tara:strand:- start:222 stop:503 length:282 start_codon:yes stop_codon:yes gene_type:complete
MKKDELVQHAKEEFGVELDKKQKLSDLEAQVEVLEKKKPVKETKKSSGKKDPIASKGEHGKIVPWNPIHREEHWTFIYDERSLSEEEKKQLGL